MVIEGDHLRHFAGCLSLAESVPYTLQDAGELASQWLTRGFAVIFSYPVAPNKLSLIEDRLPPDVAIHRFSLQPSLEVCRRQRGTRVLEDREIARIAEMYEERQREGVVGELIDNSDLTADECAAVIHAKIRGLSI